MKKEEKPKEEEGVEILQIPKSPKANLFTNDLKIEEEPITIDNLRLLTNEEFSDKLSQTKLMLGRKREGNYLDKRQQEKTMREYTHFDRTGKVLELEITDNVFYRNTIPNNYFVPVDPRNLDRDQYKNTTINKIIKPIIYSDQKTMSFNFTLEDLVENNGIILKLKIENENISNFIQLDGDPYVLIKSLQLLIDNEIVEEHSNWGHNIQFAMEINNKYKSLSKTIGDTVLTKSHNPLQQGIEGTLIAPKEYGNNLIFNPPNSFKKYLDVNRIVDGKIDYSYSNVVDYEIIIRLYAFGNLFSQLEEKKQLNDMRGASKITLVVTINDQAFFVPVFDARIQDLINAAVNNTQYVNYRKLKDQLMNIKKYSKLSKWKDFLLSTMNKQKIEYKNIINRYNDVFTLSKDGKYNVIIDFVDDNGEIKEKNSNDNIKLIFNLIFGIKLEDIDEEEIKMKLEEKKISFVFAKLEDKKDSIEIDRTEIVGKSKYYLIILNIGIKNEIKNIRILYTKQIQIPEVEFLEITNKDFFKTVDDLKHDNYDKYWNVDNIKKLPHEIKNSLKKIFNDSITEADVKDPDPQKLFEKMETYNETSFIYLQRQEIKEKVKTSDITNLDVIIKETKILSKLGIKSDNAKGITNAIIPNFMRTKEKALYYNYSNTSKNTNYILYDSEPYYKIVTKGNSTVIQVNHELKKIGDNEVEITVDYYLPLELNKYPRIRNVATLNDTILIKLISVFNTDSFIKLVRKLDKSPEKQFLSSKDEEAVKKILNTSDKGKIEDIKEIVKKIYPFFSPINLDVTVENFEDWVPFKIKDENSIQLPFEKEDLVKNKKIKIESALKYSDIFKRVYDVYKDPSLYSNEILTLINLGTLFNEEILNSVKIDDLTKEKIILYDGIYGSPFWKTLFHISLHEENILYSKPFYSSLILSENEQKQIKPRKETLIENIGLFYNLEEAMNPVSDNMLDYYINMFKYCIECILGNKADIDNLINNEKAIKDFNYEFVMPPYLIYNAKKNTFLSPNYDKNEKKFELKGKKYFIEKTDNGTEFISLEIKDIIKEFLLDSEYLVVYYFYENNNIEINESSGFLNGFKTAASLALTGIKKTYNISKNIIKGVIGTMKYLNPFEIYYKLSGNKAKDKEEQIRGMLKTCLNFILNLDFFEKLVSAEKCSYTESKNLEFGLKDGKMEIKDYFDKKLDKEMSLSFVESSSFLEQILEKALYNCFEMYKNIKEDVFFIDKNVILFVSNLINLINRFIIEFNVNLESRLHLFVSLPYIEEILLKIIDGIKEQKKKVQENNDKVADDKKKIENYQLSKEIIILLTDLLAIFTNGGYIGESGFTKPLVDKLNDLMDPKFIEKIELEFTEKIYELKERPWISQYEYLTLIKEKRLGGDLSISNEFSVTDAILEIKCLGINTVPEPIASINGVIPKHIFTEIYSGVFDVEQDFFLPLRNPFVKRLYIFFENIELSKYPTYRKSTKISIPLDTLAIIVGENIYPESFFRGKINDSSKNKHFLEELAYTLRKLNGASGDIDLLENTTIFNRMNYALRESTTEFITKKLYNIDSGDFFNFSDKTNRVVDAVFGANDEIISQFMLGFDLERIEKTLGSPPISEFRFTFEYSKMSEFKNKLKIHIFSDYYVS